MKPPPLPSGRPFPLGVTLEEGGANVAVFSDHAERVELCLFDAAGARETARLELPERTDGVFHGFVPGLGPGQVYGLRAHGPWAPERGHRFNPAKLLLDPHAKALVGRFLWEGPNLVDPKAPFALDPRDTAPFVPKAVVVAPSAPASGRPRSPWDRTVLYEAHVKGLTRLHPAVPPRERGTYLGLAHPAVLDHLVRLGVTAIELLPVAVFLDELRLVRLGLRNHWGYNPCAFQVVEPRYGLGDPPGEFRAMVAALHGVGIEVILDAVFNHTAETDHLGPTLSFRGLDNASYYRLDPHDPRRYLDWTGCGNTLNLAHPRVLQLVLDSLRHWASLGVDGFRFDLGATLGRERGGAFSPEAALFQAIAQDPVLGGLKLIAEPWDLGPDGYQQGRFLPPFAMWNDRFRDAARRFWRGDAAVLPELAGRLLGSAELFEARGRRPQAGINYVTSHDGFTLKDLVSYAARHNAANGEGNRDGHPENFSSNAGVEGPTDDPAVRRARDRRRRALLATLLLSQGVPMLLMGDELGRSQGGNNNAYCQDNPTSWLDWQPTAPEDRAFLGFVRRLVELRQAHPALRRTRFLHGRTRNGSGVPDVAWFARDGREKDVAHWQDPTNRCFGLLLGATDLPGEATLLLLANAHDHPVPFVLPSARPAMFWRLLLDTAADAAPPDLLAAGAVRTLAPCGLVLLEAR